jgi:hypothetical protein
VGWAVNALKANLLITFLPLLSPKIPPRLSRHLSANLSFHLSFPSSCASSCLIPASLAHNFPSHCICIAPPAQNNSPTFLFHPIFPSISLSPLCRRPAPLNPCPLHCRHSLCCRHSAYPLYKRLSLLLTLLELIGGFRYWFMPLVRVLSLLSMSLIASPLALHYDRLLHLLFFASYRLCPLKIDVVIPPTIQS